MKISFPIMSTSYIAFKRFIEELGHEPIVPPRPTNRTLTLGVKYAPEFACVPFKILLGTYIEACEMGTELIITSGGVGPCRAGYYGVMHKKILRDMGYNVEILVFEPPQIDLWDFFQKVRYVLKLNRLPFLEFLRAVKRAWLKLGVLDDVEYLSHEIRPYELNKGETTRVFNKCLEMIDEARTSDEIKEAKEESIKLLKAIPQDSSRDPLKVGIIGEIYVVLEPFANFDVQVTLGEMGVYTHRSIWLRTWTLGNTFMRWEENKIRKAAKPYLDQLVGGHGQNSVGETVLYAKKGYDGVIHLAPFTCIPEIVAKSILTRVSKDYDIPVLTLFIDEQTGKAGVVTRLEAFVDLMKEKRRIRSGIRNESVPGY